MINKQPEAAKPTPRYDVIHPVLGCILEDVSPETGRLVRKVYAQVGVKLKLKRRQ